MRISIAGDYCLTAPSPSSPPDYRAMFNSDLFLVNFEGPVTSGGAPWPKVGPNLSMPPSAIGRLADAGIGAVTLANNHIFDFGRAGLSATLDGLDRAGIAYAGAGLARADANAPLVLSGEHGGLALLSFAEREWNSDGDAGANLYDPISVARAVRAAMSEFQHVIVAVHGGNEHVSMPAPEMLDQLAYLAECGAAAIVLHHSHRVSGVVQRSGKPIFAGLGNFFFPMQDSSAWRTGLVAHLDIIGSEVRPSWDLIRFDSDRWPHRVPESQDPASYEQVTRTSAILNDPKAHSQAWSSEIDHFAESYLAFMTTAPGSGRASALFRQAQARYLMPHMPSNMRLWRSLLATPAHQFAAIAALESALARQDADRQKPRLG